MPILDYLVPTICLPIQQQRVPLTSESYITCLVYTHTHRLFQSLSYFLSHSLSFISFPFRWPIHTHRGTLTSTFTLSLSLTHSHTHLWWWWWSSSAPRKEPEKLGRKQKAVESAFWVPAASFSSSVSCFFWFATITTTTTTTAHFLKAVNGTAKRMAK